MTPVKDRVKAYRQAQEKKGLVEVRVWVPKGDRDNIKKCAKGLRKEYDKLPVASYDPNETKPVAVKVSA